MGAHISRKDPNRAQGFLGMGSWGLGLPENSSSPSSSSSSRSATLGHFWTKALTDQGHRPSGKGGFPEKGAVSGLIL